MAESTDDGVDICPVCREPIAELERTRCILTTRCKHQICYECYTSLPNECCPLCKAPLMCPEDVDPVLFWVVGIAFIQLALSLAPKSYSVGLLHLLPDVLLAYRYKTYYQNTCYWDRIVQMPYRWSFLVFFLIFYWLVWFDPITLRVAAIFIPLLSLDVGLTRYLFHRRLLAPQGSRKR